MTASVMNETQFTETVEQIFTAIEYAIDDSGAALDYEGSSGVLTIDCEDSDTQVIISRQVAMQQIWVAAKSGGFHCDYVQGADEWRCTTTSETLADLINRVLSEQSDQPLSLDWSI